MTSRFQLPLVGLAFATALTLASTTTGEESSHPAMKDPSKATETAPATFTAKFETTKGNIEFGCERDWAPHGVDRFYNLVKIGYFQDVAFFRVISGFMAQFGIHGNPDVSKHWRTANLKVDPVKKSNTLGMLTFAMAGSPTTRSTQLFINYGNNARLDKTGFAPICKISKGMDIATKLYNVYGDKPSRRQSDIQSKGNAYLKEAWPELDYITKTSILKEGKKAAPSADGKDAKEGKKDPGASPDSKKDKGDTSTYIIVGLLAAGVLLAIMFLRSTREEEDEEVPRPRKKRSSTGKKRGTRAQSGVKKGARSSATTSKKKKTRKKSKARKKKATSTGSDAS